MRAYLMIAALAVTVVLLLARAGSTQDRAIGDTECTADGAGHAVLYESDNGIGTSTPIDPDDDDD